MTTAIDDRIFAMADRYRELELAVLTDDRAKAALHDAVDTFCDDFHDDPWSYLNRDVHPDLDEQVLLDMSDIDCALLVGSSIHELFRINLDDPDWP